MGTLYAVLKLNTNAFDAALAKSSGKWAAFTSTLKAGVFLAAEAFGAVLVGSVVAATSFQKHMTESLAIFVGVSDAMRQKMEQAARDVAKTTLFSANEAADAFYFLASAGYSAEQSIAALPRVAMFAQAGLVNLDDATRMLSTIMTTFGLNVDDTAQNMLNMARVTDAITEAANEGQATIEGIADSLSRQAGPALRSVNKSIEEGVAVLAVFADQGVIGARAGTALAIVLRDLQTKAIKNKDEFAKFGVSVFDSTGKMRNMADIVGDLEHALAGMSDKQKKATLLEMGFQDRSVGFLLNLIGMSDKIREYQTNIENAGGATQTVADKQLASFSAQLTIMWHKITDVGIAIGTALLPALTDTVTAIGNWVDANEDLIVSIITGLVSAIGLLADFLLAVLGPAFAYLGDQIKPVIRFFEQLADAWDKVFNKIAPEVEKVGGLMETFSERVEKSSDSMQHWRETTEDTLDGLNPLVGMLEALREKYDLVAEALSPVIDYLQENNILGKLLAGTIVAVLGGALVALVGWLLPFVGIAAAVIGATAALDAAWNEWGADVTTGIGQALQWLSDNVLPKIQDGLTWFSEHVVPDVQRAFKAVGDWVADHKDEILEFLGHVGDVGGTAFDIIIKAIEIAEPILVHIAEVVLPLLGTAADVMLTAVNTLFDKLGDVWKWLGDRFNDLGIKFDDFKGSFAVLTPVLDAFIVLLTVRMALAFAGWIADIGRVIVLMGVDLVVAVGKASVAVGTGTIVSGTGFMGRLAALAALIGGPLTLTIAVATAAWVSDFGGFRSAIMGAISDLTKLLGLMPVEPGKNGLPNAGYLNLWPTSLTPTQTVAPYLRPTAPGFASGTPWFGGGWAMVGEQGPELVRLPRGSSVSSASETAGMLGGGGLSVAIDKIEISGVGNDVSPGAARRFAQSVIDEVALGLQEQSARFGNRPRVLLG